MLDLIIALKECLGLVLLTGLITGYLFTLFSAREQYKPKVKKLTANISQNKTQTESLEAEYVATQKQIQKEQDESSKIDKELEETEKNIHLHKEAITALQKVNQDSSNRYATVQSMLKTQEDRLRQIKTDLGTDTVESLSQKIDKQQSVIHKLDADLMREDETLNDKLERHERILAQKDSFEEETEKLKSKLAELHADLSAAEAKLPVYEEELKIKISSLLQQIQGWYAKIKKYKSKLLELKESR